MGVPRNRGLVVAGCVPARRRRGMALAPMQAEVLDLRHCTRAVRQATVPGRKYLLAEC
jgi:hypothetical protein